MANPDDECPLVLIEWEDSAQPIAEWQYLADFEGLSIVECASVGWLIQDDDKVKVLAPNIGDVGNPETAQASGVIRIPSRCVTRISQLSETDQH